MRKNIFEILSEGFDIKYEIKTIWQLFKIESNINVMNNLGYIDSSMSILDFVNFYSFGNWKSRNRCVSPLDMMKRLGIYEHNIYTLDIFSEKVLLVLEYIINIISLCEIVINKNSKFKVNNAYRLLKENINTFIEHFGYETYNFKEEEQIILIEKNPTAISAAEISEPEIAKKIIQYNHYTLKGDIEAKKEILITLANEVEPRRKELEKVNSSLSDDLFFMLNNMNLRHNNIEPNDKNYRPFIATMDKSVLESWYDETYQMILLVKLLLDNIARTTNIKTLKKNITETQNESEVDN